MRKLLLFTISLLIPVLSAGGGMWLPLLLENLNEEEMKGMGSLWDITEPEVVKARRTCCGLVLNAMGFIENGN